MSNFPTQISTMDYTLVTGASKGIGKAFAYELASRNHHLILTARSEPLLLGLAEEIRTKFGVEVHFYAGDLTKEEVVNGLVNLCETKGLKVNMLINNAGFGLWGKFCDLSLDEQLEMMNLNMSSLVSLTHRFLPILTQSKPSYILNVASVASYVAIPSFSIYAATKAFVLSFSRSLRVEMKESGVVVCCLCPGATESEFLQRAGMQSLGEMAGPFNMTAEQVAKIGINGMLRKKAEIVPGIINKLARGGIGLTPKRFMEMVTGKIYEDRKP